MVMYPLTDRSWEVATVHVPATHRQTHESAAFREGLIRVVKTVLRISQDTTSRFRGLWFGVMFGIAIVLIGVGGGYAYGGKKSTFSPDQFKIILVLSRTLEVHGIIMLVLGFSLIFSLARLTSRFDHRNVIIARYVLGLVVFYSAWCTYGFASAYVLNHHYNSAMWWYLVTALFAFLLLIFTPPQLVPTMLAGRSDRA